MFLLGVWGWWGTNAHGLNIDRAYPQNLGTSVLTSIGCTTFLKALSHASIALSAFRM